MLDEVKNPSGSKKTEMGALNLTRRKSCPVIGYGFLK